MDLCLIFLSFLPYFAVKGVFGVDPDEVKSVNEGDCVTLHTDVIKQKDDLIVWSYGPEKTVVARINGKASSTMLSPDERFRDRLELNHQTGDLTIKNITSQHSGLYTLRISSNNKVSYKTFSVTVNGHVPFLRLNPVTKNPQDLDSSESPDQQVIVITAVVFSVFSVIIIVFIIIFVVYMKKRMAGPWKSSEGENRLTDEKLSINSSSTSEDQETSRCLKEKQHRIGAESV